MKLTVKEYSSINEFQSSSWDQLNINKNPFLQHRFLAALESSGCVSSKTGWQIAHLGWTDENGQLQAVLPNYYKSHSYGEYMFDWAWAQGISQAGIAYYPKAVSAIPFTPVPGERLMISATLQSNSSVRSELIQGILSALKHQDLSNIQCLFLIESETSSWSEAGAMIRQGYQFTWYNDHYKSFDDFLDKLKSSARKKIKRERRILIDKGVNFKRFEDQQISEQIWQFFIQCYQQTYLKRSGHYGYLNDDFFQLLKQNMAKDLLVICAYRDEKPVASSLFIKGNNILYGRYWGAMELIDGLHFDCCYYQGIDYCIENGLECLQPGTQGDYKRRRGFIPEKVYGAYFFNNNNLQQSIQQYLDEESEQINLQFAEWQKTSPYKKH